MREPIILTSPHNQQVKAWRELNRSRAARLSAGLFLAEGEHMAGEALKEKKADALIVRQGDEQRYAPLLRLAQEQELALYLVSDAVLTVLSDAKTPQGVTALCAFASLPTVQDRQVLVALDDVQDPGNVGTILRTLDAAGFSGLILSKGSADPYSPKALRASMGAVYRVPCAAVNDLPKTLSDLRMQGYDIMAGTLDGTPFYERGRDAERVCLVIGNEGAGISEPVLCQASRRVRLPMRGGAESLNAAVACAIMLYDLLRAKEYRDERPLNG